ncbi:hypothetical protein [Geodermatophilus sp. URMC 62]|uniref:hypothetical protein n=1 Tax=Geodermatophilus sp. URMC 62 TaxID=3423414 RepID=UPI00406CD835
MPTSHPSRRLKDLDTDEVHYIAVRAVPRHRQAFTLLFCAPLLMLLRTEGRRHEGDEPLRPVHLRVLLYLVATCGYENQVQRHVSDIADDLGHDRSTVSRALLALRERALVRTESVAGRPLTIHLHPALCFRGKPAQRAAALRDHWDDAPMPAALSGDWLA